MMKIELDRASVNDLKDKLFVNFLIDDLSFIIMDSGSHQHPDDVKYDKKLIKAYKRILDYYGHDTE